MEWKNPRLSDMRVVRQEELEKLGPDTLKSRISALRPEIDKAIADLDPHELEMTRSIRKQTLELKIDGNEHIALMQDTLEPQYANALCYLFDGKEPSPLYLTAVLEIIEPSLN